MYNSIKSAKYNTTVLRNQLKLMSKNTLFIKAVNELMVKCKMEKNKTLAFCKLSTQEYNTIKTIYDNFYHECEKFKMKILANS